MVSWYSDELDAETGDIPDEADPLRSIIITPMSPTSAARFWFEDRLPPTHVFSSSVATQTDGEKTAVWNNDRRCRDQTSSCSSSQRQPMKSSRQNWPAYEQCFVISDDEATTGNNETKWSTRITPMSPVSAARFQYEDHQPPTHVSMGTVATESDDQLTTAVGMAMNGGDSGGGDGVVVVIGDGVEDSKDWNTSNAAQLNSENCKTSSSSSSCEVLSIQLFTDDERGEFGCAECGKLFKGSQNLRKHFCIHGGEKPHKCTQCDKCFRRRGQLLVHTRSHSGEKPYECKLCGRRFRQCSHLVVHIRVHSGEKLFSCKLCSMRYTQSHNLKKHLSRHTERINNTCNLPLGDKKGTRSITMLKCKSTTESEKCPPIKTADFTHHSATTGSTLGQPVKEEHKGVVTSEEHKGVVTSVEHKGVVETDKYKLLSSIDDCKSRLAGVQSQQTRRSKFDPISKLTESSYDVKMKRQCDSHKLQYSLYTPWLQPGIADRVSASHCVNADQRCNALVQVKPEQDDASLADNGNTSLSRRNQMHQ